jgi:hypothetical protein
MVEMLFCHQDMELAFASTTNRVTTLESQNIVLQTNVEEKETVVAQNSQELTNVKAERAALQQQVRVCAGRSKHVD